MAFSVPLSSTRLLVPPLRLISAFMWRVVQQQKLEHYDKVEENILFITKIFPEILSERQRSALIMGLRAKMILEMCRDDLPADLETVKACLNSAESANMSKTTGSDVQALQGRLLQLVVSLLEDPVKKQHFFQEVFPVEYGPEFDKSIEVLVRYFLSRLEQLLPVPNFEQAAQWLDTESSCWEDLVQVNWYPDNLLPLWKSDYCGILEANVLSSVVEDRIISSLSLALLANVDSPIVDQTDNLLLSLETISQDLNLESGTGISVFDVFTSNQDVNKENETVVHHHDIFTTDQTDDQNETELAEEFVSAQSNILEKKDLSERMNESSFCDTAVQTLKTSQHERETEVEDVRPEASTLGSEINADPGHSGDGADKQADESTAPEAKSGQRLKVIVPKHLVPVVKQISLPSVLLTRCTSSETVPLKAVPAKNTVRLRNTSLSGNTRIQTRRQTRLHKERPASTGNYKCVTCNLSFKTHFQASIHKRRWHTNFMYSCPKCDKSFKSMKAWTRHRSEHKEEKPQQCTDCGEQCPSLQALVAHSKIHNHVVSQDVQSPEKATPPQKRCPGECRFCGKTFTPIELRNHLKTHPEFRPHQCDHCGKCFANLGNLLAHISNHTGEKPHSCLHCGKKFFSKALLKAHMKTHSSHPSYCCSYCGKCFQNAGNLNIHLRIHTGEKPYQCMECGKAFSSAGQLQVHKRCHTGEKPYQCEVCGRGFVVSSHRTIHMRSHTGFKPYACEICGKTFARKNCWNDHLYSHTDAKPFSCSLCTKSFTRRTHLKRHMESHSSKNGHGGDNAESADPAEVGDNGDNGHIFDQGDVV
ncbi:zinc finger protein 3-like [Trichomycterus rosablanca]|uniref:zinc finger protein 3-like n=1 Tax=Trichomycterus rosablanca TaxID=2290929 RepID=UPI002F35E5FD